MASSADVQTLLAAFFFGILLQAALGVLLIQVKGNEGSIREDGRRLALVLFLIFAALWALIDFINLNITASTTSCQAALAFSTVADQLARVCIEQFLLWSIGHGSIPTLAQLILQFALGVRFIVGAVLVGFTRPHFAPVCVARTSVLPIAIVVLALDAVIIIGLTIRSMSISVPGRGQKKALIFIVGAFALWTGTSAAMLLGIPSVILIIRTTLPSIGLLILVGFVTIFAASILSPSEGTVIPEATSPFITQSLSAERGIPESSGNGSRISANHFQRVGSPMFFNPPTMSQTAYNTTTTIQGSYPESRRVPTTSGLDRRMLPSEASQNHYRGEGNKSGNHIHSGSANLAFMESVVTNRQGMAISQKGFVGSMERDLPVPAQATRTLQQKRALFKWPKQAPPSSVRAIGISAPVIVNNDDLPQPFAKIKTIDLATAANNERERREDAANRARLIPKRPAPPPPSASIEAALHKSISVKRKEVLGRRSEAIFDLPHNAVPGLLVGSASVGTTSASLSPGHQNVRQRSPRGTNGFESKADKNASKYGLQRKPTIGLPSNPRSQKATMVKKINIHEQDEEQYSSEIKLNSSEVMLETSYGTELKSSGSILHRPRPYRRDTEKDRALFPSGVDPHHRSSKFGSPMAAARKSIFESHPGSPTQLPYIPAPPPRQADWAHILSNGTKSMSYHEKIQFLFPTPPLATLSNNRRSSAPSIPRLPSVYMSDSSPVQSPTDDGQQSSRASKKSRVISFETEDIWESVAIPTDAEGRSFQRDQSEKRSNRYNAEAFTSNEAIPTVQSNFTRTESQLNAKKITETLEATSRNAKRALREAAVSGSYTSDDGRQTFLLDDNQIRPGDISSGPRNEAAWHRRIGDELPTFSERRQNFRTRKMLPPRPLLLNWTQKNISVVVHSPAPSPIDSPGKAMKSLQAQLKHFEDPNHVSANFSPQRTLYNEPTAVENNRDEGNNRSKLLQDLEEEIGLQESLWQKMQHSFDRDSNSIVLTPQPPMPTNDDSPQVLLQQSLPQHERTHIMKRWSRSRGSSSSTSSRSSNNSRASAWQQRLNEAQLEYLEGAQALNRNRNFNFFSIAQAQVGSPTPPESVDSETEIETGSEFGLELSDMELGVQCLKDWLWQPQPPPSEPEVNGLWDPVVIKASRNTSIDAPAKDLRPLKRLVQDPLRICSSVLWSKPISSSTGTYLALWGSRKVRPKSINIRRISQRSQRMVKRIGYLPDIVESPQPLPHKRDTLGIFQFPSGETSDSAIHRSAFSPTLLYHPSKLNGVLQNKTGNQGPDFTEYPSSFFDDYDEQDDFEGLDSDDDFDESTLWEISNLLYSRDLSSIEDFEPLSNETRNAPVTYEDGIRFDMEPEEEDIIIGMATERPAVIHDSTLELPIRPLALASNIHPRLWTNISEAKVSNDINGLAQPDSKTWETYVSISPSSKRKNSRQSQTLPLLASSSLWSPSYLEIPIRNHAGLWTAGSVSSKAIRPLNHASETPLSLLWTHVVQKSIDGSLTADKSMLWAPAEGVNASSNILYGRGSENTGNPSPPFLVKVRKARPDHAPLAQLMSHRLWSGPNVLDAEHHWISESSVRPESPSIRSDSSSGGSSPTSDTLSIKSSSTKASSIWSSLKSVQVSLSWNSKPPKSSALPMPTETNESSGSPISPPRPRLLPPKRDSKALALRDIFESRASASGETPRSSISDRTSLLNSAACSSNDDNGYSQTLSQTEQLCHYPDFILQLNPNANPVQVIARSKISDVRYDAATRHPVFFTSNLLSNIADIHPAAIGYTTNHPITRDVLPNTTSPSFEASPKALMQSGIFARTASAEKSEFLWSKDLVLQTSNKSEDVNQKTLKMWNPSLKIQNSKNTALIATTQSSSQDLTLGERKFAGKHTSRQLPLPVIRSGRLFEPRVSPSEPPTHWLHSTSHMPETSHRSLTWEAPLSVAIQEHGNAGMWARQTTVANPSTTLFSNPHKAPWARKKRYTMSAKDVASSELWRLPAELPTKPKHWLVDRRASRVQFRY